MDKRSVNYALSIFLKNGDVLHLSGLRREEKDRYFTLARNPEMSMLIEEPNGIRNLLGSDIAGITYKKYNDSYEKSFFQVKKMLLSESSFGKEVYWNIIKFFLFVAFLWIIKELVLGMLSGDLMTNIMDTDILFKLFSKGLDSANSVFKYAYILLFSVSLVDIVLGLLAKYYINQDGAPPIRVRRCYGFVLTILFMITIAILKALIV